MTGTGERIRLPNGYWIDGVHYREAELRMLTGADEEFLIDSGMLPVTRATALLARCLTRLDGVDYVTPESVRRLIIGDREALLLHLRRLTLGEEIQGVLACPRSECGELMDIELKVNELLQPPYHKPKPVYEETVESDKRMFHVRYHLPTGIEQEAAALVACKDVSAAGELLLKRCVELVSDDKGNDTDWSPEMLAGLPARIAELDPQSELILNFVCPTCGESFSTQFDAGVFLFQEIASTSANLYRQVHLLALHYHWGEAEIMSMKTSKRRRYLNLLLDSIHQVESM